MKKTMVVLLAMAALTLMVSADAATFFAPKGAEINASVDGDIATISWTGMEVSAVHQYRFDNSDKKGFILKLTPTGNSVTFNVFEGDRFQILNKDGEYVFLSPELAVANYTPIKFNGVIIECSNKKGCCLQVK